MSNAVGPCLRPYGAGSARLEHGRSVRIEVTLDCVDLEVTAAFWQAVLRYDRDQVIEGRYASLSGDGPTLTLQRVPEPKVAKNRVHLDLLVADVDGEVDRLQSLGATVLPPGARDEFGQRWFVLADPEGNEFCVAAVPEQ
jgi:predicted enzyme related to lactoylglutathione lyase